MSASKKYDSYIVAAVMQVMLSWGIQAREPYMHAVVWRKALVYKLAIFVGLISFKIYKQSRFTVKSESS